VTGPEKTANKIIGRKRVKEGQVSDNSPNERMSMRENAGFPTSRISLEILTTLKTLIPLISYAHKSQHNDDVFIIDE